jgi:hypothetical protein
LSISVRILPPPVLFEIIREFIEKIIVLKAEKVNGVRTQRIQIIYNCIGAVELPETHEKTA